MATTVVTWMRVRTVQIIQIQTVQIIHTQVTAAMKRMELRMVEHGEKLDRTIALLQQGQLSQRPGDLIDWADIAIDPDTGFVGARRTEIRSPPQHAYSHAPPRAGALSATLLSADCPDFIPRTAAVAALAGRGGFGTVYLGLWTQNVVAVKKLDVAGGGVIDPRTAKKARGGGIGIDSFPAGLPACRLLLFSTTVASPPNPSLAR